MREWITRWKSRAGSTAKAEVPVVKRQPREMSGAYLSLYTYLEHRYADVVVLSFREIEDLSGFALPDLARTRQDWWTAEGAGSEKPPHSDAWTLAGRTARPNLIAQNVCFERTPILGRT